MIKSCAALLSMLGVAMIAEAIGADAPRHLPNGSKPPYAYATNGVLDAEVNRIGAKWKLLLDPSNLGGNEFEAAELTLAAGTNVPGHTHGSVEVIYVLSGVYGHEVNGKLYLLEPGMIGIVRPGDTVRHLVPKAGPTKVLIIWGPPGEAAKAFRSAKGVAPEPVAEAKALEP